jgi:hypothetical protein
MRRWSRGRLDEPLSEMEVRGWESRASSCGGLVVAVAVVVCEVEACVVGGGGWGGEGSAGGVRGCKGEGGGRVVGDAISGGAGRGRS